jgi:hypothetical protein
MTVDQTAIIDGNRPGYQAAACPLGARRLEGSCRAVLYSDITLVESGFYSSGDLNGWICSYRNNNATPATIKASVTCLLPPGS